MTAEIVSQDFNQPTLSTSEERSAASRERGRAARAAKQSTLETWAAAGWDQDERDRFALNTVRLIEAATRGHPDARAAIIARAITYNTTRPSQLYEALESIEGGRSAMELLFEIHRAVLGWED